VIDAAPPNQYVGARVHSELEQLLVLQDRQQKIRQIQTEIKTLPLQRSHLESQLAASAAGVEALKQKGWHLEIDRKRLELDVGTRTETISRLKTQQYQTRKNDEFQAIGHEIERYENEIRRLEDEELEVMLQADKIKAELEAAEKAARATKESISRQLSDLETKSKTLESRQEELAKEREELAGKVDGDLLGRFERLFNSKGDAAIVAIEHGVCTGCHMKVTTATAAGVKAGKEIVSCEQCGRILYLGA
jgi:predicted  nucleic acid-binding Zn-ribbon protein